MMRRTRGQGTGRGLGCALSLGMLTGALLPLPDAATAQSAERDNQVTSGRIVVEVSGFRNDEGDALVALFRSEQGFPKEPTQAERRLAHRIEHGRSQVTFEDVTPGAFAVSVLHDEDGDRKVRTSPLGIPREGIGFSRDARAVFGPPKFRKAKLELPAGAEVSVPIRVRYY